MGIPVKIPFLQKSFHRNSETWGPPDFHGSDVQYYKMVDVF